MNVILLAARLVLVISFAVAGSAKLADLQGSRQAVVNFGLPSAMAAPLGLLLPLAELAVAAALIPASTALWGAAGALTLLLLFIVGISVNLVQGRRPDCHCFGQLHSAPAGWKTLARNGVLALLAGLLVWQGWNGHLGPSAVAWLGALPAIQLLMLAGGVAVLALLAGQWWFLLHLLRQNGRLLVRVEALEENPGGSEAVLRPSPNGTQHSQTTSGLPVGSEAPNFDLKGLHGERLTLLSLRSWEKPLLLLFTDPGCGPCNAMLPEVGRWQEQHAWRLTTVLVSRGTPEENATKAQEHDLENVVLQEDWEVSEAYRVSGTPGAVLVSAAGTVASPVAGGAEAIGDLVARAVGERTQLPMRAAEGQPCPNCGKVHPNGNGSQQAAMPTGVKVGQPAPEVRLPDLDGRSVGLEDFRGEDTLVLFWNPGCGFCQRMLPDIKEWEKTHPEGAPRLLFVSAGTEESNRAMGLASTVVLDQQFAVGRAFGASGTPSAVLVDAEGNVASELAVGAPGVLELAQTRQTEA